MPGSRDENLRSGDLNEQLGLTMLAEIGLVAPVPRTEDVGGDAFVTLLRRQPPRRLIPEDSFLVQIKSWGQPTIAYRGKEEIGWLLGLDLPLFVARADRSVARLALYPLHRLVQISVGGIEWEEIVLHFDQIDEGASGKGKRVLNIGPPALEWTIAEGHRSGFRDHAYEILKPHLASMRRNLESRRIGRYEMLTWDVNKPPTVQSTAILFNPARSLPVLESLIPGIQSWLMETHSRKWHRDLPVLVAVIEAMRQHGVDPDPGGHNLRMAIICCDGTDLPDEEFIAWRRVAFMGHLDLGNSRADDRMMSLIPEDAEYLAVHGTKVTDRGVAPLARLKGLKRLNLARTHVTDEVLTYLAGCESLSWVDLSRTAVTSAAIAQFQSIRPNVTVVTNSTT